MPFDPVTAAIRFGLGLSPRLAPPESADAMMARLAGPDEAARRLPIPPYATAEPSYRTYNLATRLRRDGATEATRRLGATMREELAPAARRARATFLAVALARATTTEDALRERLVLFWADHFTVKARTGFARHLVQPFVEEAVRPHVAGRFADMLAAVTTHPMMLLYLDGARSVGPSSPAGRDGARGLNENHARELLELHTVGVGAPYGQADVRELAELLTGLAVGREGVMAFEANRAEPGAETVMGRAYPAEGGLSAIRAALDDLAGRPETAAHLGRKLAVHFVADAPDPGLAPALAEAFAATRGDLAQVARTLLDHEAAWAPERLKVKPPFDWMASALRALGADAGLVTGLPARRIDRTFARPLAAMGQPWNEPPGPDGWPEAAAAWVTPPTLAARIDWAVNRPEELLPDLPDPRELASTALGGTAAEPLLLAVRAAERRSEGVGLVLASPDFQRR